VNAIFSTILKIAGIGIIVAGLSLLLSLAVSTIYVFLHNGNIIQGNLFPVGLKEHLLLYIGIAIIGLIAIFIVLLGMALFQRKWPIRTWITGTLIGLIFVGLAFGSALAADVAPQIRDRYNASMHTSVRTVAPFTHVNLDATNDATINYQMSRTYSVSLRAYDHPDLSNVKTTVSNGTLVVDTRQFHWYKDCQSICIPRNLSLSITVNSPNPPEIVSPDYPPMPKYQPDYLQ
jgi:hypothetical protein